MAFLGQNKKEKQVDMMDILSEIYDRTKKLDSIDFELLDKKINEIGAMLVRIEEKKSEPSEEKIELSPRAKQINNLLDENKLSIKQLESALNELKSKGV